MHIINYYRSLSAELKAFFSVANKEVGQGAVLELFAEKAGLPAKLTEGERAKLRELAAARNVRIDI